MPLSVGGGAGSSSNTMSPGRASMGWGIVLQWDPGAKPPAEADEYQNIE